MCILLIHQHSLLCGKICAEIIYRYQNEEYNCFQINRDEFLSQQTSWVFIHRLNGSKMCRYNAIQCPCAKTSDSNCVNTHMHTHINAPTQHIK